jgi:hypothetical protein
MNLDFSWTKMIIELIGTWMVIGFFSAIGWGTAQKTVVEPYINPAIEKVMPAEPTKTEAPSADNK